MLTINFMKIQKNKKKLRDTNTYNKKIARKLKNNSLKFFKFNYQVKNSMLLVCLASKFNHLICQYIKEQTE